MLVVRMGYSLAANGLLVISERSSFDNVTFEY